MLSKFIFSIYRIAKKYSRTFKKGVESVVFLTFLNGKMKKIEYENVHLGGDAVSTLSSSEDEIENPVIDVEKMKRILNARDVMHITPITSDDENLHDHEQSQKT